MRTLIETTKKIAIAGLAALVVTAALLAIAIENAGADTLTPVGGAAQCTVAMYDSLPSSGYSSNYWGAASFGNAIPDFGLFPYTIECQNVVVSGANDIVVAIQPYSGGDIWDFPIQLSQSEGGYGDSEVSTSGSEVLDIASGYTQSNGNGDSCTGGALYPADPNGCTATEEQVPNTGDNTVWAVATTPEDVGTSTGQESGYFYENRSTTPLGPATYSVGTLTLGQFPCNLVSVSGNTSAPTSDGTTAYNYTVSYSGPAAIIVAADVSVAASEGDQITVEGQNFSSDSTVVDNPGDPSVIPVTFATGELVNPAFYCYYAGTWYTWGVLNTFGVGGGTGVPGITGPGSTTPTGTSSDYCSFDEWLQDSGMSLTNPFSWVSGGLEMGKGLIECLFVPSSASVSALTNQFGFSANGGASGCGATNPTSVSGSVTQWLGAGFTLISDGPSCSFGTMQSEEAAGETSSYLSTGDTFTAGGHSFTVSLPSAINAATGNSTVNPFFVLLLAIFTAIIGIGFFFSMKAIIQWLLARYS
jgi:hypothetical protein